MLMKGKNVVVAETPPYASVESAIQWLQPFCPVKLNRFGYAKFSAVTWTIAEFLD